MNHKATGALTSRPEIDSLSGVSRQVRHVALAKAVSVGTFLGLAWGASLRAWMVMVALELGDRPVMTVKGTFAAVLMPAALVGALLGGAYQSAGAAEQRLWKWVLLLPVLFVAGPLAFQENFVPTLISTGMGGGAIGVALIGMLGGYSVSGLGTRWVRWATGALAFLLAIASVFPIYFGNRDARMLSVGKVFGMLLFALLMLLLIAGVSAPARRWRIRLNLER